MYYISLTKLTDFVPILFVDFSISLVTWELFRYSTPAKLLLNVIRVFLLLFLCAQTLVSFHLYTCHVDLKTKCMNLWRKSSFTYNHFSTMIWLLYHMKDLQGIQLYLEYRKLLAESFDDYKIREYVLEGTLYTSFVYICYSWKYQNT